MNPYVFKSKNGDRPLVDADGIPIRIGSILRHLDGRTQGVVVWIGFPDDRHVAFAAPPLAAVGDIAVRYMRGSTRVGNEYDQWRHVAAAETTPWQRMTAWLHRPYDHDEDMGITRDEGLAIDGIMSLLPDDMIDREYDAEPGSLEDALWLLVEHLENLTLAR